MSQRIQDYLDALSHEVEVEFGRLQRQHEELLSFSHRLAIDKKRLTEQNIKLIERVRELEELYESDLVMRRFTFRTSQDSGIREGDKTLC